MMGLLVLSSITELPCLCLYLNAFVVTVEGYRKLCDEVGSHFTDNFSVIIQILWLFSFP